MVKAERVIHSLGLIKRFPEKSFMGGLDKYYVKAFDDNNIITDFPKSENMPPLPKRIGETGSLSKMFPLLDYTSKSRSAHFTIKTVKGVQSRDVNIDILQACDLETAAVYSKLDFVSISHGQVCHYGSGMCCVYFDEPVKVQTLFAGYN